MERDQRSQYLKDLFRLHIDHRTYGEDLYKVFGRDEHGNPGRSTDIEQASPLAMYDSVTQMLRREIEVRLAEPDAYDEGELRMLNWMLNESTSMTIESIQQRLAGRGR